MPTRRSPRKGSMQFWPRKRASRSYPRIRSWPAVKEAQPLAFAGYKVGMTHIVAVNEDKNSHLKNEQVQVPVTIVECPPMRIYSARFYKKEGSALKLDKEIFFKAQKDLSKKVHLAKPNAQEIEQLNPDDYDSITITVYTQPSKLGFSKKKPEIFEIAVGGSNSEQVQFIKDNQDKDIDITSLFADNDHVDVHGITKGKGNQGPMKRFGIGNRLHKSEKSIRNPGSLGPWVRQQHISWRVPHAGQTGFFQRVEYNKQILEISDDLAKYGENFHKYGNLKSKYIVVHGSVQGPRKRLLVFSKPKRKASRKYKLAVQ